jgi:hypothetical protein
VTVFIDEESESIEPLPSIFRYQLDNSIGIGFFCLHLTLCCITDKVDVVFLKLHLSIGDQTLSAAIMDQRAVAVSMCRFNIVKEIE